MSGFALIQIGPGGRQALADSFTQDHYRIDAESLVEISEVVGKSGLADSRLAATPTVAFAAAGQEHRLSDHFGIEARVNLSPAADLSEAVGPLSISRSGCSIAAGRSALTTRDSTPSGGY